MCWAGWKASAAWPSSPSGPSMQLAHSTIVIGRRSTWRHPVIFRLRVTGLYDSGIEAPAKDTTMRPISRACRAIVDDHPRRIADAETELRVRQASARATEETEEGSEAARARSREGARRRHASHASHRAPKRITRRLKWLQASSGSTTTRRASA